MTISTGYAICCAYRVVSIPAVLSGCAICFRLSTAYLLCYHLSVVLSGCAIQYATVMPSAAAYISMLYVFVCIVLCKDVSSVPCICVLCICVRCGVCYVFVLAMHLRARCICMYQTQVCDRLVCI
jgi:hypothetical protein